MAVPSSNKWYVIVNTYRLSYFAASLTPFKLYMGVAADCEYVNHYGSRSNASRQILTIWNTATALYKVRERDIFFYYLLGPSSSHN